MWLFSQGSDHGGSLARIRLSIENGVEISPIIANKERQYFPVKSTILLFLN
jgi:hypothetical protein